jgi:hypothetical protein
MKTSIKAISLVVFFSMALATTASALVNYPQSWYSGSCVNISRDLSLRTRGSDVLNLQTFLVSQNFPGSGTWMETGLFGAATHAAVSDFQQEQSLAVTGIADYATRNAIERLTCGGLVAYTAPTATTYPTTIPWNGYGTNYPYGYNNLVSLNLTSLSQNTGTVGTQVTIYGTGFDSVNNTVNFGSVALTNVPSNGTSISFIVPAYTTSGSVNITVTDSLGTSNALVFTVNSYGYGCGSNYLYPYNTYNSTYGGSCGCANTYPYYFGSSLSGNCGTSIPTGGNITAPTAYYLNPISGGTGTSVTVLGSGFTATGNAVHFGTGVISNLISSDGQSVSFIVPTQLVGYGSQNTGLGVYNVSVTNGSGYTTNTLPFTVTSLGNNGSTVTISGISGPTSVAVGTQGTWTVTLNNPNLSPVTVTANWGDNSSYPYNNGNFAPQTTTVQGMTTLSFTHVYTANGNYTATFTASNGNGSPSTSTMTISVGGSGIYNGGAPTISYLAPNAGYVGTQVTIYGSNLSSVNTILFGNGAIQNVYSSNGTSITFTVPSYVTPYCASGYACPQYAQQITHGTYNVSVLGSNGTSNAISFNVQ